MAEGQIENSLFAESVFTIFMIGDDARNAEPVCIFKVPNSHSSTKPEAYVPQQAGLGPYHHQRVEIQHMQMYKIAEAKRILMAFGSSVTFEKLVEVLQEMIVPSVRARYNTYLDMPDIDLACIMAIDGLFLFDLIGFYGIDHDSSNFEFFRKMVSYDERKLDRDSTLRDAMILESQIPMLVLKFILIVEGKHSDEHHQETEDYSQETEDDSQETENDSQETEDDSQETKDDSQEREDDSQEMEDESQEMEDDSQEMEDESQEMEDESQEMEDDYQEMEVESLAVVSEVFPLILLGFCQAVSPLKVLKNYPPLKALRHHHLLDLLYHLIVLKDLPSKNFKEEEEEVKFIKDMSKKVRRALYLMVYASTFDLAETAAGLMAGVMESKVFKVAEGLFKIPFQTLISSIQDLTTQEPPPFLPRASKLCEAGVKFCPRGEDNHITNIRFDPNTASFHLPVIWLNVNSEVIIRNLVAYEAMINSESKSLVLTRYSELMSELIETVEDVKVLKDHGIISKAESIDDEEIAKMFKGMRKRERVTNPLKDDDKLVPLERAIKDVNSYYHGTWKVKVKKWGRITWKLNKVLLALVVVFLLAIQSVCSVYDCPGLHHLKNTSQLQRSSLGRKLNWI